MEFLLILIIFPAIVFIMSIVGYLLTKKSFVTPAIVFVLFSFFMLLFSNESFFIWVIVYTLISVVASIIMVFIMKKKYKTQPRQ